MKGLSSNNFCTIPLLSGFQMENINLIPSWFRSSCLQIFYKIGFLKKHLCRGYFLTKLQVCRSEHRYFKWTLQNFWKILFTENSGWLLLLIPPFQPRFYALITFCLFFLHFFRFIIDNSNYGSLFRKCIKIKLFLFFTIFYPKIEMNAIKIILLWQ